MFLQSFPDLTWLKRQAEENFREGRSWKGDALPQKGWPNVILNVQANQVYRDNIRGPLSLFMNVRGESIVETDGRSARVREGFFYITNQGQHYTLSIDEKTTTETFNIHFGEYLVDHVWQSLTQKENDLLDNLFKVPPEPLAFHNRLLRKSERFNRLLYQLKEIAPSALKTEEILAELVEALLQEEMNLRSLSEKLPATKQATRQEILRRLSFATDFLYANFDRDISLDEIAEASCLSKYHFLRLFKTTFNKTPGQFLDEIRVGIAIRRITKTKQSIHDIARELGYRNSSSFSRMFHQRVGVYPSALRG
jgi:AraC family transcriptional regulator